MKKLLFSVMSILLLFSLVSCALFGEEHKVSFFANGEVIETVQSGVINPPDTPERENYIFDGWFYDKECEKPLGAYDKASGDLTLYAGFRLDYESLVNEIAKTTVRSNVTVYSTSYNTGLFGNVTDQVLANGSGVIFKQTNAYYYCLTNCHVVEKREEFSNVKFTITDCFENEYNEVTLVAKDSEYDLAVLRFQKSDASLGTVRLSASAPSIGDTVIAITQPKGQKNTVTFGEYTRFDEVIIEGNSTGSHITFPVIYHTAPVDHGSSGGVLLNERLELIGINFAVATDKENGEFLAGLAVPLDKVNEFINSVL